MKQIIYAAGVSLLALTACQKDLALENETEKEKFIVNFTTSNFDVTTEKVAKHSVLVSMQDTSSPKFAYGLYTSSGLLLKKRITSIDNPQAPKLQTRDTLPAGKYIAVFTATTGDFDTYFSKMLDQTSIYSNVLEVLSDKSEIFTIIDTFSVKDDDTRILFLHRALAKMKLVLTDPIPPQVKRIEVVSLNTLNNYYLASNNNWGWGPARIGIFNDFSKALSNNVFITTHSQNLSIRAFGIDDKLIAEKSVNSVPFKRNEVTIITGKLFDAAGPGLGQSFSVHLNTQWNSKPNEVKF